MSSPGSRATRDLVRAIKHALIGRCASTCRSRQVGVGARGLEITQVRARSARPQCGEDSINVRRVRGKIEQYRAKSRSGAPALMKLITTFPLEHYDILTFGLR